MLKVAIVGYGYWGPNLVRNFVDNPMTDVSYVCDIDESRLRSFKLKDKRIKTTANYKDILKDDNVELLAVSTPLSTHYRITKDALLAGKHVLIEKPMTAKVSQAESLIELAEKRNLTIFVDHTFVYTGAVRKMKELISSGEIGRIYYFDSVRLNLGLFQKDINVIWDLAPHDFSIMDYLIEEEIMSISAIGGNCVLGKIEDIAYVTVKFQNGLVAHFHLNWLSPVKIRRILIGGSKKMIVFDDLNPDEKVKIYDKGVTLMSPSRNRLYKNLVQYRIGDMYSPTVDRTEALKTEVSHLVNCIKNKKKPLTDGQAGLRVVKLLEAAQRSLIKGGVFVKI